MQARQPRFPSRGAWRGGQGMSECYKVEPLAVATLDGDRSELDLHGCDLWTFRDGFVVKKDSYWKIRTGG